MPKRPKVPGLRAIRVQRFAQTGVLGVFCVVKESITCVFSVRRYSSTPAASTIISTSGLLGQLSQLH